MNATSSTFFIRIVLITSIFVLAAFLRAKFSKPRVENQQQKPGKLQRLALIILISVTIIFALMAILGIVMNEIQMGFISGVLALVMSATSMYINSSLKTSYEENEEFFGIKVKNKENKLFYKDISNWDTSLNEMIVYGPPEQNTQPLKINVVFFKPELLLRKIADMTFEGKFLHAHNKVSNDLNREKEIVNFLVSNQYGYLVEDYSEKIKQKNHINFPSSKRD